MLSVAFYAECRHAHCRYSECRGTSGVLGRHDIQHNDFTQWFHRIKDPFRH
jgi:hypothetical protein